MLDFTDLARLRADLVDTTERHIASVNYFRDPNHNSFYKMASDKREGKQLPDDGKLHRLTTTFTCIESLYSADQKGRDSAKPVLQEFSANALVHPDEWESEGAARTYCRVRALGPLLLLHDDLSSTQREATSQLLRSAWEGVAPGRYTEGLFEAGKEAQDPKDRYPPNAYLSYWGLVALDNCGDEALKDDLVPRRRLVESWLESALARQTALYYSGSKRSDPQQLAWAVCGFVSASPDALPDRATYAFDLVAGGLQAFFAQQDAGSWPRGEPLFHYPQSGNAYCYPFETLAELIHLALGESDLAESIQYLLEPYAASLFASYEFAQRTFRHLEEPSLTVDAGRPIGWCSGHHPHRTTPESWATATVFRFLQGLRRLVGIWTRRRAAISLGARVSDTSKDALGDWGDTWDTGNGSAGMQLASLFVNPIRALPRVDSTDPELPVLDKNQARSAILYGPSGTGKTTFIKAVASAIGWKFIEITPAMFLDRGVEHVSARADEAFRQLMELDRHVILFDEIDEVIRRRDGQADPLERFFTTTMLPRLAKLWDHRRLLFFVNTNSIDSVDPAIRRSHRFDAAMFVLPPSFERKHATLRDGDVGNVVTPGVKAEVTALLSGESSSVPVDRHDLAWFGLATREQVDRLVGALKDSSKAGSSLAIWRRNKDKDPLLTNLREIGRELMSADWEAPTGETTREAVITRFERLTSYQRVDPDMIRVVEAHPELVPPADVKELGPSPRINGTAWKFWQVTATGSLADWASKHGLIVRSDATVVSGSPSA